MKTLKNSDTQQLLIFSQAASPASPSALQAYSEAWKITVTSGQKCCALLRKCGPAGLLVKMLLESSTWHSKKSVHLWKAKAMKSGRLLFQLRPSGRGIDGTESGYMLPTPVATDAKTGKKQIMPNGRTKQGYAPRLTDLVAANFLHTPTAQDGDNSTLPPSQLERDSIQGWMLRQVGTQTGGRLNPNFVEYLMGYPQDWTKVEDSASSS